MIKITLEPEYVLRIGNFLVTNSILSTWIAFLILVTLALIIRLTLTPFPSRFSFQNIIGSGYEYLFNIVEGLIKDPILSRRVAPLVATFFIFILTSNWLGLVPGFLGSFRVIENSHTFPLLKSPSADLNTTLALAIISVLSIQILGIQTLGLKNYLKRFFDFTNPIKLFYGLFEFLSDLIKILSFSFRLFGNIFGGEVLLIVIAFLVPYFIPLPFMLIELFVGFIQALIFSMLTLVFIKAAQAHFSLEKALVEGESSET